MREIIPLSTLPAFEASARHESFKMAAEELNLSQAACAGQGIALGWKYLCDALLESGALVRPISDTLRTDRGYYLLLPHGSPMRKEFNGIYGWIMEQVSAEDLCDGPHERHLPA